MYPLKQSTAITVPFFAHDANGDGVTGIADGSFTKRISKNGGAFAAMTVTISEMENGWYSLPVSTSHSDTLGVLSVSLSAAGAKRVNLQFRVHAALPDDHASASALATVQADTDDIQTKIGTPTNLGGGSATLAGNMQDIEAQTDDIGAAGAGLTAVPWNAAWDAEVQSEVEDGLIAHNLDHLVGTATGIPAVPAGTFLDQIMDDGTAVYDRTTDSLQAARDAVIADTDDIQAKIGSPVNLGGGTSTLAGNLQDIEAQTDDIGAAGAGLTALASQASVNTIDDFLDTEIADIRNRLPAALVNGKMDSSVSEIVAAVLAAIADALLDRNMATGTDSGSTTVRTVRQALRLLRNKAAIAGGILTVNKEDDATTSWTATVTTAAGNPITEINPAGP